MSIAMWLMFAAYYLVIGYLIGRARVFVWLEWRSLPWGFRFLAFPLSSVLSEDCPSRTLLEAYEHRNCDHPRITFGWYQAMVMVTWGLTLLELTGVLVWMICMALLSAVYIAICLSWETYDTVRDWLRARAKKRTAKT
jgi:hypothetical protein